MKFRFATLLCFLPIPMSAIADAPPAPASTTVCSLDNRTCATLEADMRSATIWRKGSKGRRVSIWTAPIASTHVAVADDGRSLVELYRGLNLLENDAGPETVVLTFHRPGLSPVHIRLRDVIARPTQLRTTVSHRKWAAMYGYENAHSFVLKTADGRTIRYDPATGRRLG